MRQVPSMDATPSASGRPPPIASRGATTKGSCVEQAKFLLASREAKAIVL
ncbi:hypothetical protein [Candidatus Aalborgicola defluviihabitans]|nr:hypothetical protein [Burkholderiales bacterium]